MRARRLPWLLCCLFSLVPLAALAEPGLAFRIDEGQNLNSFLRDGPVAAHLLLREGREPRVLVAFPAGNSGVGLWFATAGKPVKWKLAAPPRAVTVDDARQRPLRGISFEVEADARRLQVRAAVLSSVRVLRDFELLGQVPGEVSAAAVVRDGAIRWARDRLDGAAGYELSITAGRGTQVTAREFVATPGQPLRLEVRALCGEEPLAPLASPLTTAAGQDTRSRNVLAFLGYQQKWLAGSWRFDTYFGRDTLMSVLLLAPVLEPPAVESAIASVLDRLSPEGEVAHEEDIGEFAVLRNAREGRGKSAAPIYDYGMVDDDFMLAPLAARWLLDDERGRRRALEFLARQDADGESHGAALARNLQWVVQRTQAFAADPRATNLVSIKSGRATGNWRDSEQGLGGGRYPYDINAALVPAALAAAARLADSGLLDGYLGGEQRRALLQARERAATWAARAPRLFEVELATAQARAVVSNYSRLAGVDAAPAIQALQGDALVFHALSLDSAGRPIPILSSDEGFRLLFTEPSAQELDRYVVPLLRPFPAGLLTEAGMVVANPAPASARLREQFGRTAYHGTVIWSWQQALMAAGLERQLGRDDLPPDTRVRLERVRTELWRVIGNARALRTSELWSWSFARGQYRAEPFGRPGADVDESNAAQLWSTVYLGLQPPRSGTSPGN